ncbi:hypothetical protein CTAYLR_007522 [Chrysophaeum taylorii]|uniref:AMP-dependent synthetase/ligase domain-containing protein n=1 Tax=Chrysophaeum taylorii TaxID=2483200 RepID=A0AAD7U6U0_9STRA|nr:hypothetical protein CTAYLR_007522 [Chrysophaeum taylorii]
MISHRNIWHNLNEIYLPGQHNFLGSRAGNDARLHDLSVPSARVVAVSWLPQFHDSGLMLMLFGPFLAGCHQYFGYRLCTKRAADEETSDIDLSCCLVYCVGGVGQRCVPSLLREFAAYFAIHCKLPDDDGNRGIFVPNYGLAEHVVATCGENDGLVASRRRPDLVSCGSDFLVNLRVVDVRTRRVVPDGGTPGELWLSSDSVARGYCGKPELSNETFRARLYYYPPDDGRIYLRTGDEAFMEQGRLFICGRIKNLIVIGGEKYYSDDVEVAATEALADAARPGCIAAFALVGTNEEEEEENEYIVLEIRAEVRAGKFKKSRADVEDEDFQGRWFETATRCVRQAEDYFKDDERKATAPGN